MQVPLTYRYNESQTSQSALSFYQSLTYDLGVPTDRTIDGTGYERLVEEYSWRQLTYETDAIHAFTGIEKLLSRRIPGRFVCGIPDLLLDEALLWKPVLDIPPPPRLRPFPTWSWASWNGPVYYDHQWGIRSVISWFDTRDDGSIGFSDNTWIKTGGHKPTRVWGADAEHSRTMGEQMVQKFNETISKTDEHARQQAKTASGKQEAHILAFCTKSVSLRLKPYGRPKGGSAGWLICNGDEETRSSTSRHSIEHGTPTTIAVDEKWFLERGDQPYEFILIALECRSFVQAAHIMLIEWDDGTAKRVGLTKMDWFSWQEARPHMKFIGLK